VFGKRLAAESQVQPVFARIVKKVLGIGVEKLAQSPFSSRDCLMVGALERTPLIKGVMPNREVRNEPDLLRGYLLLSRYLIQISLVGKDSFKL
jgi:hypothetical protein